MHFLKNHKVILAFLSVIFFILYSHLYVGTHDLFNSPDETSGHFFVKRLAEGRSLHAPLSLSDALNGEAQSIVTPRSMRVINNSLVPASFVGMILAYGAFTYFFGSIFLYILPALIAIAGVWGFYFLVRFVWWEQLAFVSAILMFMLPPWWYYATLGFFPNVFLITLVIWATVFLTQYSIHAQYRYLTLSSLFVGAALVVRLAALPWIFIIFAGIGIAHYQRNKSLKSIAVFLVILVVPTVLYFFINNYVFGGALATGYVLVHVTDGTSSLKNIFPEGIQPTIAIISFIKYYAMLLWFLSIPTLLGIILFLNRLHKVSSIQKLYAFILIGITTWLTLYYGSWILTDNINNEISLGVSYSRYWLPYTVGALPFAVYAVHVLFNYFRYTYFLKILFSTFFLLFYVVIASNVTYNKNTDSLSAIKETLEENRVKKNFVLNRTEDDAIIMTYRQDKIFFPARAVIHSRGDADTFSQLPELLKEHPVYLYTFFEEKIITDKIVPLAIQNNLSLVRIDTIYNDTLYQLTTKDAAIE